MKPFIYTELTSKDSDLDIESSKVTDMVSKDGIIREGLATKEDYLFLSWDTFNSLKLALKEDVQKVNK
jgi:hypothetical protein